MATDTILGNLATQLTATAQLEALNLIYAREATLATSAKQDTAQASLTSIDGKLTGAATAARQDTGNAALLSIDVKTPALVSGATPVSLPTAQVSALTPPAPITGYATETTLESLRAQSNTGIRGVRRDTDDTPASDGGSHSIFTNQVGRLKSSSWPGAYTAVTGTITANAQTVIADVARASNITIYCTGTFAGINVTFEGSLDGTNWFAVTAARTNANTAELTTGVLAAAPAYAWELSVNGYSSFRVRSTAYTSGTQTWTMVRGAYATEPAPVIQTHPVTGSGTFTVAGTVTDIPAAGTPFALTSAATTNPTSVKASGGSIYEFSVANFTGTTCYFKLYNKASAPTVGTDTPILTVQIASGTTYVTDFGPLGKRLNTGIAYALTAGTGLATDTTAATAGVQISGTYL